MSEVEAALADEPVGAVAAVFGERVPLARGFHRHLATTAVERGLIGPREVPRLWDRHLLNCAAISEFVPPDSRVVDVGSGAGLPGLVLAIARPDLRVTLVEPLQRRVVWLHEVVEDLSLANVTVTRARAEELRGRLEADVSTARAVAALPVLAQWCLPLVRPGGLLLALKGRSAAEELESSVAELQSLGARSWTVRSAGEGLLDEPATVVEVVAGELIVPGKQTRARRRAVRSPEAREAGSHRRNRRRFP